MKEKCFDIGTVQAFLDGELAAEKSAQFCNHIAVCDACAVALSEAEEETAFAFNALEGEFNTLVPTQRLWTKINDSITEEKKQSSVWNRAWAFLTVSLLNPSITVAAGIFVVFGIFAVALVMRPVAETETIATVYQPKTTINQTAIPTVKTESREVVTPAFEEPQTRNVRAVAARQNPPRPNDLQKLVVRADYREPQKPKIEDQRPIAQPALFLPGEESYVKTISTLKQTVDGQKDAVMKPSSRVAFERDLAVVNDSIKRMKEEVRRNPKNETAKQILYASYQNKIDLLNSVAERNELMASLK